VPALVRVWLIGTCGRPGKIYVSHIDISSVQCYKTTNVDEILDRFVHADLSNRVERAKGRRQPRIDYRVIVERHFGKHTGLPHPAKACLSGPAQCWPAARRPWPKPRQPSSRGVGARIVVIRREPMGISFDKPARDRSSSPGEVRPATEIKPVPTAGSKRMSLKFEIRPS